MLKEDEVIRIELAREPESWYKWAGYALVIGLGLSYTIAPGAWIVYVLCAYSFGLVYWGYECYKQFASYYNSIQFKEMGSIKDIEEFLKHLEGTSQDNDGLKVCEEEEDEQD